jgi:hypothetical protein
VPVSACHGDDDLPCAGKHYRRNGSILFVLLPLVPITAGRTAADAGGVREGQLPVVRQRASDSL